MLELLPATALPPLPPASAEVTPEYLEQLARNNPDALELPPEWGAALEAHGWLFVGSNQSYLFFERPGYWLRVHTFSDNQGWTATVIPEEMRVPRPTLGNAGYWLPFPLEQRAPDFRGKGAQTRAQAAAKALWLAHEPLLKELGIELVATGARLYHGSGSGGYVAPKAFRRDTLFPET